MKISSIAVLRLSAIGDCCHVVPLMHALRANFDCPITWIIGSLEYQLFAPLANAIPHLDFIVYDKQRGVDADLKQTLKERRFDVLLDLQTAFRASLLARKIKARRKIGFGWQQSREGQYLFCNEHLKPAPKLHFVELFLKFVSHLGGSVDDLSWHLPQVAPFAAPRELVVIHPVSSSAYKNWHLEGWRAVCAYILANSNFDIYITGAPSQAELAIGDALASMHPRCQNMVGRSNLAQLYAFIGAAEWVISPDTSALHIATLANTKAVGLFAVSDLRQTGPYHSLEHCVDKYPEALQLFLNKDIGSVPFGKRINHLNAMRLIDSAAVTDKIALLL